MACPVFNFYLYSVKCCPLPLSNCIHFKLFSRFSVFLNFPSVVITYIKVAILNQKAVQCLYILMTFQIDIK